MSHQLCLAFVFCFTLLISAARSQPKLDRYRDSLPPGAVARLGTTRFRHFRDLIGIRYSHDGKRIIGLAQNDKIPRNQALRVWDADSGRVLRSFDTGYQYPRGFALAPKSELAATIGSYFDRFGLKRIYSVKVIDTKAKQQRQAVKWLKQHPYSCAAWSPDEKTMAMASHDGTVRIVQAATGKVLLSGKPAARHFLALCYSPDGKTIAAATRQGVILWKWSGRHSPKLIPTGRRGAVAVDFSMDGQLVAAATHGDKGIYLISAKTHKTLRTLKPPGVHYPSFADVQFTPDGKYLLGSISYAKQVAMWRIPGGDWVRTIDMSPTRPEKLAVSSDSRRLAVTSDTVIRQWSLPSGREIQPFPHAHLAGGVHVAFSRDPKTIVTGGRDGAIRLWDVKTQQQKLLMRHDHPLGGYPSIGALAYSPDGKWIASAATDNTTRLWNARTGAEVYKLPGHEEHGITSQIAFSADSKRFATSGDDMRLRVWEVRTGKALSENRLRLGGDEPVNSLDVDEDSGKREPDPFGGKLALRPTGFSHDAARFFGQNEDVLCLFDTATGKMLRRFVRERVGGLAASSTGRTVLLAMVGRPTQTPLPGGKRRVSGAKHHTLALMDAKTGRTIWSIEGIEGYAEALAYSPNQLRLAVAPSRYPPVIHVYNAAGEKLQTIRGFSGVVHSLAFSADGRLLAAGISDTTALVWKVAP